MFFVKFLICFGISCIGNGYILVLELRRPPTPPPPPPGPGPLGLGPLALLWLLLQKSHRAHINEDPQYKMSKMDYRGKIGQACSRPPDPPRIPWTQKTLILDLLGPCEASGRVKGGPYTYSLVLQTPIPPNP